MNVEFVIYHISYSDTSSQSYMRSKQSTEEYLSNCLPVRCAIPQGPLLFILYINAVPHRTQGRALLNMAQDVQELEANILR
jgi:hypothetical protein